MNPIAYLVIVALVAVGIGTVFHETSKPKHVPPVVVAAKVAPVEDSVPDCLELLDTLAPTEAANCVEEITRKAVVFIEIPAHDDDGPVQMVMLLAKDGGLTTYDRHELLTSHWLRLLLKHLDERGLVQRQWFTPFNPIAGSCI